MFKTKRTVTVCLAFTFLFALAAVLSPVPARAEDAEPPSVNAELMLPKDGYFYFNNLLDVSVNLGANTASPEDDVLYILDHNTWTDDAPARIIAYSGGFVTDTLTLSPDVMPRRTAISENTLFVYDDNAEQIFAVDCTDPAALSPITGFAIDTRRFRDMTVFQGKLYVLANNRVSEYDAADLTAAPREHVPENIRDAQSFAVYYSQDATPQILFLKQYNPGNFALYNYDTIKTTVSAVCTTLPKTAVKVAAGNRTALVTASDAVYTVDLNRVDGNNVVSVTPLTESAPALPGNLASAAAVTVLSEGDLKDVYIADNLLMTVQKFRLTASGTLEYGGLCLSSFGAAEGRLNDPKDVFERNQQRYVLDAGNNRIQILDAAGNTAKILALPEGTAAKNIAVDGALTLYVSTENDLYRASVQDTSVTLEKVVNTFSGITSLAVNLKNELYLTDSAGVWKISGETVSKVLSGACVAACTDLKEEYLYAATSTGVVQKALSGGGEERSYPLAGIADLDIDFSGNLLILGEDAAGTYVQKKSFASEEEPLTLRLYADTGNGSEVDLASPTALALDTTTGETLVAFGENHFVVLLAKDALDTSTSSDVPVLTPPVNILDGLPNDGQTVPAIIEGWPSTIIYPVFDTVENYPPGHCYTDTGSVTTVPNGTTVLLLGSALGNENYYYILYGDKACFIMNNAVNNRISEKKPAYTDGLVLHSAVNVYKYPSTAAENGDYLFRCGELAKNTPVTVLSRVADYRDAAEILWYKISYETDTGTAFGYVARENVTERVGWTPNADEKIGKIKSEISEGRVDYYGTTATADGAIGQFKDGTEITILKDFENGWMYVKSADAEGYVLSKYVTFDPLTAAQIVGICLLCSAVILLIAALILFKIVKTRARRKV